MFQPSSPTRRRESTPLLEKIKTDVTLARARLAAALEGKKGEPKKPSKPKDETPMMKYLKLQVRIEIVFTWGCQQILSNTKQKNIECLNPLASVNFLYVLLVGPGDRFMKYWDIYLWNTLYIPVSQSQWISEQPI